MSYGSQDRLAAPVDRRWLVLVVVAIAQLMVVLDSTIVNIALPSAQRSLGFSNNDRQWVVTAYALAFGSLLLVGGRLGDMYSRKRVFITGLAGVPGAVLDFVAGQLGISDPSEVRKYTKRANIRFGPFPLLSVQIPYTRSNVRDMAQRRAGGELWARH